MTLALECIDFRTTWVMNPFCSGHLPRVISMGMANVLQSIKDAEDAADAKIAASKEEAAKIIADARKEEAEIIQNAQDGAVSSTVKTLDSARSKAAGSRRCAG